MSKTAKNRDVVTAIVTHKKDALRLSKSEFLVESMDFPKALSAQIVLATVDFDKREDKARNYSLRLGILETYDNVRDLFELSTGLNIPESIWLRTYSDQGNLVSAREFTNLVLRSSSIGYAKLGTKKEAPLCFINFDAILSNRDTRQVEV